MEAADIPIEMRHRYVTIESYIEGPRWRLPEGWIRKNVIKFNHELEAQNKGWSRVKVLSETADNSLMRRLITFELGGEAYPVQLFLNILEEAVKADQGW